MGAKVVTGAEIVQTAAFEQQRSVNSMIYLHA